MSVSVVSVPDCPAAGIAEESLFEFFFFFNNPDFLYHIRTPCRVRTYHRQLRRWLLLYPPELKMLILSFRKVYKVI